MSNKKNTYALVIGFLFFSAFAKAQVTEQLQSRESEIPVEEPFEVEETVIESTESWYSSGLTRTDFETFYEYGMERHYIPNSYEATWGDWTSSNFQMGINTHDDQITMHWNDNAYDFIILKEKEQSNGDTVFVCKDDEGIYMISIFNGAIKYIQMLETHTGVLIEFTSSY